MFIVPDQECFEMDYNENRIMKSYKGVEVVLKMICMCLKVSLGPWETPTGNVAAIEHLLNPFLE